MELFLHPGDEYVGSLEPGSLQVLTFVRLYLPDVKTLKIKTSCTPLQFPKECPPFLKTGGSTVASGADAVMTYLREQYSLGGGTEGDDDLMPYSALLTDRLLPAMLYSKWLDSRNYVDFTRSSYGSLLRFPLALFYLSWQHRAVHNLIMRGSLPQEVTVEQRGLELTSKAEECIDVIAAKLGTGDYFNGDMVSILDVLMLGYLECIIQSPHSGGDPLSKKVHSHGNLVSFCQRMRKRVFPGIHSRSLEGGSSQLTESVPKSLWRDPALWASVGVVSIVLCIQGARVGLFNKLSHWAANRKLSNS